VKIARNSGYLFGQVWVGNVLGAENIYEKESME
jgi:hypothetical protein